ncbi:MAG: mannitol dehydrogenase family protein, partial [Pseudomonadota bacterium]
VPTIGDRLKAGDPIDGLALESAFWCRYCCGETEAGETIPPNDPDWDNLQTTARAAQDDPSRWLAMSDVYGEVGQDPRFLAAFTKALDAVTNDGVEASLKAYLA